MANALESASLVMIPSGYENGTLGSLKPTDGSGDFTFSRGSNTSATRVNADGYIEKGYENLLLQSNTFSDAAWTKFRSAITGGQQGYDGSNNAWLFNSDTSGANLNYQGYSFSGVNTFSVYAKQGTTNALRFRFDTSAGVFQVNFFLIENGTIEELNSFIDSTITSIGNGWYRCSATLSETINIPRIYTYNSINGAGAAGDNIYIQDAMLNQGLVAYPYIETTTASVAGGILEDMPRLDYSNGSCPALLLEPQRTNLIAHSEYFDTYEATKENNATLSPEGYLNATSLIDNASNNAHLIFSTSGTSSQSAGNYTASAFLKRGAQQYGGIRMALNSFSALFFVLLDLENGNVVDTNQSGSGTFTYGVENYSNGWYRVWISSYHTSGNISVAAGSSNTASPSYTIGAPKYIGDGTSAIYAYGFQIEQDATYQTSYIPTYGVSQTRLAEDVELPSLSSVFDSSGDYTILFEIERLAAPIEAQFFYIRSSSFNYITLSAASGGKCEIVLFDGATGASATTPTNSFITGSSIKIAVKISGNNCSAFANGTELTLSLANTTPRGFDRYQTNKNHLKYQEVYFSTALTDSECIELTTI